MKIKFDKKQKKNILFVVVVVGVVGAFMLSKFGGSSSEIRSPEESSVANQNLGSSVTTTGPDVESLIDDTSPIARSAREAEEREAQQTRDSGESYIGNIFIRETRSDPVINIPRFEPEPEPEPEPEIVMPQVPGIPVQEEPDGKRIAQINLDDIRGAGPTGQVSVNAVIDRNRSEQRLAGGMTVFAEYDREEIEARRNSVEELIDNSAPRMYEASSPSYRNGNRVQSAENLKVTLGSKYYATIGFAINSDDGGPALAQIHEGPLAGARLQGSYQLNELAKAVNISFDRMSFQGETYSISAIAYDLETERPVIADRVNNRRLERYGGLFLSAFVAGYADTLRDTTTNVTEGGNVISESSSIDRDRDRITYALSEPARIISQELRSNVNRPITVYVSHGRGAGIYFLDDVEIQK